MQAVDEGMCPPTEGLSADDIEEQACNSSPELVELSAHQYFSSTLQNAQKTYLHSWRANKMSMCIPKPGETWQDHEEE